MSHVDLVVFRAKRYEAVLRRDMQARGYGLGQLVASCGWRLSSILREKLREVGRIRNVLVHEDEISQLPDARSFTDLINVVEDEFELILPTFVPRKMLEADLDPKPANATVFVSNLHEDIDEMDIYDLFAQVARTLAVELAVTKDGHSRGAALVHMAAPKGALDAMEQFNGKTIYGQPMTIFVTGTGRGFDGAEESVRFIMNRRDSGRP